MNYSIRPFWDQTMGIVFTLGNVSDQTLTGLVYNGIKTTTGAPAATAGYWLPGATVQNIVSNVLYKNTGTTAAPVWSIVDTSSASLTDGQIFYGDSSGNVVEGYQFGKSDKTSLNKILGSTKFDDRPLGGSLHDYNVQLRAVVGKTSGTYIGLDGETHLGVSGTTSLRGTQGVAVIDSTFTGTGSTIMGLYGQARVDGSMAGASFLVGVYGLIEASSAITADHVASAWFDSHQANAVTGSHQLVYMTNNGAATLDEMFYIYGAANSFATLDTPTGYVTGGTAADGTPKKIKVIISGVAYYLNAYPTDHP